MRHFGTSLLLVLAWVSAVGASVPLDSKLVRKLGNESTGEKIEAIEGLTASGNPDAAAVLQAMIDGRLLRDGEQVVMIQGQQVLDAATLRPRGALPDSAETIIVNNRLRRVLMPALDVLKLSSKNIDERIQAAQELQNRPDPALLPMISRALTQETHTEVKDLLTLAQAEINLSNSDPAVRLSAVKALAHSNRASTKGMLLPLLEQHDSGEFVEPDPAVRAQARSSLRQIDRRLAMGEYLQELFSGLSLGSVLLLASLGLAITYGLLGVINMAHGEMLMIGAYATYVTQWVFRNYLPHLFNWYLLFALPVAFLASALVGMLMERTVIRYLYGRPLETLLATWGIGLLLIQSVRALFGAQNVEVANPSWMSGGARVLAGQVLPYNRLIIIAFALLVLGVVWLSLNRTRLGLFIRSVTQNRQMSDCVGVPVEWVDLLAFGLGSGIAGLGGCALSQLGNVGPELGQGYIVDSFMVVVLGGVGQLAGTVYASLGLGIINKFLEPFAGAVLAKIAVLAFIIVFIQKRPQGLFALKGRMAEG